MDYVLFGLAWVGHAYLLMVLVNLVYSHPWHRLFLKAFRASMGLLILVGPPLFAWGIGTHITAILCDSFHSPKYIAPAIYLAIALFMACIVLPYFTLSRVFRPRPSPIRDEKTETIDVAKALGEPPYGDGETRHMAHLPLNNIFNVDFTTLTISLPNLPAAWDGLTLLQLGDMHFIGTPSKAFFDFVIERCMAEGVPDLVMITGDIVDTDTHHEWIAPILGQLKWKVGAFAILGNHDWWQDPELVRRHLRQIGIQVVSNAWVQIDVRGEKLTVLGHEGPWFRPDPDLTQCPAEGFRILLSHTPDNIRWAQRNDVSLMLSGHNHGGQVRLPLLGSIFVPSKYSRRYDMGTFFEPPTLLHVNRGLSGKDPLRFRCNPQVTRFVFKCG